MASVSVSMTECVLDILQWSMTDPRVLARVAQARHALKKGFGLVQVKIWVVQLEIECAFSFSSLVD